MCGEKEGLILEEPFTMGETLIGASQLDINHEKELVEERLNELQAEGCTEEVITSTMKDMGIQRFVRNISQIKRKRFLFNGTHSFCLI